MSGTTGMTSSWWHAPESTWDAAMVSGIHKVLFFHRISRDSVLLFEKRVYCSDGDCLWRMQKTEFIITCVSRISLESSHHIFIARYLCTWAQMTFSRHCLLKKMHYYGCVAIPCQYSCVLLHQFLLFFVFLFSKCLDSPNFRKQQANEMCL